MLGAVNKGNFTVSTTFLAFVALMATNAGREHEPGTGAMRVAPELLAAPRPVQACDQPAAPRAELVFEILEAGDGDDELPRVLATGAREVVDFDWNEATGELTFSTTATSTVFSDLQSVSSARELPHLSCG